MLRIGICDDSAEARQHMLQLCQKYYENNTDAFEYKMYKNAEEVLEYCDDEENKKIDIYMCDSLEQTIDIAKKSSKKGDVVLFSPASASFDMFKNFADRGEKFKKLVNNI